MTLYTNSYFDKGCFFYRIPRTYTWLNIIVDETRCYYWFYDSLNYNSGGQISNRERFDNVPPGELL